MIFKNLIVSSIGGVISKVLSLLFLPVISFLYSPDDFGLYSIFLISFNLIYVISSFSLENYIFLDNKNIFNEVLNEQLSIGFLVGILIFLIQVLLFLFSIMTNVSFFLIIPLLPIFIIYNFYLNLLIQKKNFKKNSFLIIIHTSLYLLFCFLLNDFKYFNGLVLSFFLSHLIVIIYVLYELKFNIKWCLKLDKPVLFLENKNLTIYYTLNKIIDQFRELLLYSILGINFNQTLIGIYSMSIKIIKPPISILTSSVSQLILSSDMSKRNSSKRQFYFLFFGVLNSVIFYFLIIYLGEFIVKYFLSDKWKSVSSVIRQIAPWYSLILISSPIGSLLLKRNLNQISLFFSLIYLLIPAAVWVFSDKITFISYLNNLNFSMVLFLILYIVYYFKTLTNDKTSKNF